MALTPNAITLGLTNDQSPPHEPVVQMLSYQEMGNSGGATRFRATISDGMTKTSAVVTAPDVEKLRSGAIRPLAVIQIDDYKILPTHNNTRMFAIQKLHFVQQADSVIGNPVAFGQAPDKAVQPAANIVSAPMHSAPMPAYASAAAPAPFMQAPVRSGAGPIASVAGGVAMSFTPIKALNAYTQRWTIKARVTAKSDIKTYQNDKGPGKLFKFDLLDESGGEISGAFFKEAVDKFYERLHVGSVYMFSGGKVKVADQKYSKGRPYEIMFDDKTQVTPAEDDSRIGSANFTFIPGISAIVNMEPKATIDVAGMLTRVEATTELTSKAGRQLTKKDLSIADDSGASIDVTLWGTHASTFAGQQNQIVALKGLQISEWNGRTLGSNSSTVLMTEEQLAGNPRIQQLQAWRNASGGAAGMDAHNLSAKGGPGGGGDGGMSGPLSDLTQRTTAAEVRSMDPRAASDGGYNEYSSMPLDENKVHIVKATLIHLRQGVDKGPWYAACQSDRGGRKCQKKAEMEGDGVYRCRECGPTTISNRWIISGQFADHTGAVWFTAYDEVAEALLNGVKADDAAQVSVNMGFDSPNYLSIFQKANYQDYLFSCKSKMEQVKDEQRLKTTVLKVRPMTSAETVSKENIALLKYIKASMGDAASAMQM